VKVIDRSKPYQEVVGNDPRINYRYVQDGVKFDNQGKEIVEEQSAVRRASLTDDKSEAKDKTEANTATAAVTKPKGGKKGGGK